MRNYRLSLMLLACGSVVSAEAPLRLGIIGMQGHFNGVMSGGEGSATLQSASRLPSRLLVPAGGLLKRPDVQIVGIVEPNRQTFDQFADRVHLDPKLYFSTIDELISHGRPQAVWVFTSTFEHTKVVEECARRGIHVMMEKPLAVSYKDALAIAAAAEKGHIKVLVNYETSWYASNKAAYDLVQQGALGDIRRIVTHHGNSGPFPLRGGAANRLTDSRLSGAGALYDFGCYGANLATWLMKGQRPLTVTAVAKQLNPDNHSEVEDEADIILAYPSAVAIIQASWNWPFSRKHIEVYGKTGVAKTIISTTFETNKIEVRRKGEVESQVISSKDLVTPYDDPLHYFSAVINGSIQDEGSLSSLKTNLVVSEILDAARQSARSGKAIVLALVQ